MRFRCLADLIRPEHKEIVLSTLPQEMQILRFALDKAFKISELVRSVHDESYEWYGFTLAARENPEIIIDIGLPSNDENLDQYASLGPEKIATYQETLPPELVINGWIHSHGNLELRTFSSIDEENQRTVLDYVTTLLRKPISKKEIIINDLVMLVKGGYADQDLEKGSVNLITDQPVGEASLLETVFGGFCYALLIGDAGWHHQEIHYKNRGVLSGQTAVDRKKAKLVILDSEKSLTDQDVDFLREEVREKIQPITHQPENIERM
jgi:hypothetical protein